MTEPRASTDKVIEQNLVNAERARQQDAVQINRRLDDIHKRLDDLSRGFVQQLADFQTLVHETNHDLHGSLEDLKQSLDQRFDEFRKTILMLLVPVVAAILGAVLVYLSVD